LVQEKERIHDPEKLSFIFEGRALAHLREIAEREGMELDEAIESALGLKKWALDLKHDGGRVIVRREKEEDKELVL
jgi:hypothetical protein